MAERLVTARFLRSPITAAALGELELGLVVGHGVLQLEMPSVRDLRTTQLPLAIRLAKLAPFVQIRIPPIRVSDFEETLSRAPFLLLRLEPTPRVQFHPGVAEFFAAAYPAQFRFGTLSKPSIRDEAWLGNTFQSSTGRMRAGVQDGYYLFQGGVVAGHHLGKVRGASPYASSDTEAQRQRVLKYGFMGRSPGEAALESARQIVMYFDDIVARRTGTSGSDRFEHDSRGSQEQESGPRARYQPPPQRPAPPPKETSPYEVLGVSRGATDAEVKSAYKAGVRMNHPDKVSHLSAALQKFAEAQVLDIIKAYETIRQERGTP